MRQRDKLSSRRAFLLVEAALSAVVIAVGLVFINRALGGQLSALRRLEDRETMLALARGRLLEDESLHLAGSASDRREGEFDEPFAGYRWVLRTEPRADVAAEDGSPVAADASMKVEREGPPASSTALTAVWPVAWAQPQ